MIFASSEIIKESERLQEITKIEYESIKADIDSRTNFKEPEPTEIELLQQENQLLKAQNQALQDKADFHEDILTEIILELHS